ncbi:PCI domain-containing protein [Entamoeba marina]
MSGGPTIEQLLDSLTERTKREKYNDQTINEAVMKLQYRIAPVLGYILSIYHHSAKYEICHSIRGSLTPGKPDYSVFFDAIDAGFCGYYSGLLDIYCCDYNNVITSFEKAYAVASDKFKCAILFYLVPLQLRRGKYIDRKILENYNLDLLIELCDIVRSGNIASFDKFMVTNEVGINKMGSYHLYNSLRLIVFRNFLEMVFEACGSTKLMFKSIIDAAKAIGAELDNISIVNYITNMVDKKILFAQVFVELNALSARPTKPLSFYDDKLE